MKRQGIIDYWAMEAAKVTPPPGTMVRMRAPPDWDDDQHASDHVAVGGNRYPLKDGIAEVEGWDAKFLLPLGFEVDVGQRTHRASQEGRAESNG